MNVPRTPSPGEECCICFENMDSIYNKITLQCNHTFHNKCIYNWSNKNNNVNETIDNKIVINGLCPICNSPYINVISLNNKPPKKSCCCIIQ